MAKSCTYLCIHIFSTKIYYCFGGKEGQFALPFLILQYSTSVFFFSKSCLLVYLALIFLDFSFASVAAIEKVFFFFFLDGHTH